MGAELAVTLDPRETFLAERRGGIGGSDIQHVFDIAPWGCSLKLWREKRGETPDHPFEGNNATERGTRLEAIAAQVYTERTGRELRRVTLARKHRSFPFLLCHLDRMVVNDSRGPGALSIKVPGREAYYAIKRSGLPEGYIMQAQHEMLVTGWQWASFAIFWADGWDLLHWDIPRDETLIERIREKAIAFWGLVENGPMPPKLQPKDPRCRKCDYRTSCQGEALLAVMGEDAATECARDDSFAPLLAEYLDCASIAEEASGLAESAKDALKAALGDRTAVECAGSRIYYRPQTARRVDTTALRKKYPQIADELERPTVSRPLRIFTL